MKLKRFVAKDMKTALLMIKEELGSEAIIISNKRIEGGVEIVAGVDENALPPKKHLAAPKAAAATSHLSNADKARSILERLDMSEDAVTLGLDRARAGANTASKGPQLAGSLSDILQRQSAQTSANNVLAPRDQAELKQSLSDSFNGPGPLFKNEEFKSLFQQTKEKIALEEEERRSGISSYKTDAKRNLNDVKDEVAEIRRLLQFELAGLIQETKSREKPVRAMVEKLLLTAGFSVDVASMLADSVSADASFNFAWREIADILIDNIEVGDDEIINDGGIITLIGPAGVGKTTTLAKLAARFVMKYGADRVAIISSDNYRIGAIEQVKTYGRIMGCACLSVKSLNELPEVLYTLKDKSLVLIDTAGVGLKDQRFATQIAQLKLQSVLHLKHYLVFPATVQKRVLEQVYQHFKGVGLSGVILTKVDESLALGDALSLCIEERLKISYITDGQRVPEDITVPDKRMLAIKALSAVEDEAVACALHSR